MPKDGGFCAKPVNPKPNKSPRGLIGRKRLAAWVIARVCSEERAVGPRSERAHPRGDVLPAVLLLSNAAELDRLIGDERFVPREIHYGEVDPQVRRHVGRSDTTPTLFVSPELDVASMDRLVCHERRL